MRRNLFYRVGLTRRPSDRGKLSASARGRVRARKTCSTPLNISFKSLYKHAVFQDVTIFQIGPMSDFKQHQLRRQLTAIILACLLLPALIVAWMGYGQVLDTIRAEKVRSVGRVADIRRMELISVLRGAKQRSSDLLSYTSARCFNWPDWVIVESCVKEAIKLFVKNEGALKAIMHMPDHGYVVSADSSTLGGEMWEPLKPGQLTRFSKHEIGRKRTYEILAEEPKSNLQVIVIYPVRTISDLFVSDSDLGKSGETFLSDSEGFFITPARYHAIQGTSHPISAYPMQTCLSVKDGEVLDLDYRNVPIIHGFRYIAEIGGGCIMAHIDQAEAFGPLRDLKLHIALLIAFFVVTAVVSSIKIGDRVTQPVVKLTHATRELIGGNYSSRVQVVGNNEISELATSFNRMAERLEMTLGELKDQKAQLEVRVLERTAELELANGKLATLSQKDGLTGLANRRHLDETLAMEWRRAARQGEAISVVMVDVDRFKNFNDHYGHQQGDHCLRQVACTLAGRTLRAGELVGRYGGEEFLAILPGFDAAEATLWAKNVQSDVLELAIPHAISEFEVVTVSIGVASIAPCGVDEASSLISEADKALYQAKDNGRNQVCVAAPKAPKETDLI